MVVNVFKLWMAKSLLLSYSCIWIYKDGISSIQVIGAVEKYFSQSWVHTHTHTMDIGISALTQDRSWLCSSTVKGGGEQDDRMRGMEKSRGLNPYSQSSQHVTVPTAGPPVCFGSGHRAFWEVREQRSVCLKKLPRGLSVHFQHSTTKRFSQVSVCRKKQWSTLFILHIK